MSLATACTAPPPTYICLVGTYLMYVCVYMYIGGTTSGPSRACARTLVCSRINSIALHPGLFAWRTRARAGPDPNGGGAQCVRRCSSGGGGIRRPREDGTREREKKGPGRLGARSLAPSPKPVWERRASSWVRTRRRITGAKTWDAGRRSGWVIRSIIRSR
ncbi:hypothetical protein GGS23DRAFT_547115 [Durotheca rogersii]|uniref:uncharacterized protein n=1 Tax=Durotheca rogersii TaxID=419775 RepID=UPI00221ED30E|nr:uncharacterized protein GGS23DRAFT_547115 [Durotheca rogersii]KAI5867162.1 hypothetical protein GGS23DRAFT_547115 [Durotheca rogersii]